MFRPQSLHEEFSLVFSGDPGLELPEVPEIPKEGATEQQVLLRDHALQERLTVLRVARETGRWPVKSGSEVTVFRMRSIHGTKLTWLRGEALRLNLSSDEGFELAFRLAIKAIENFGKLELKFDSERGQKLMTLDSLDELYSIGRDIGAPLLGRSIVMELGNLVMDRAIAGVPPK